MESTRGGIDHVAIHGRRERVRWVVDRLDPWMARSTNYLEREARNRSLGLAGEEFVLNYERARLIHAGREKLAARIEHTSVVRGDHEGYDILSFEDSGAERLIEVKTTKYGKDTPFFLSRNEVAVSGRESERYFLYRMFAFRDAPGMYSLTGAMDKACELSPTTFLGHAALIPYRASNGRKG